MSIAVVLGTGQRQYRDGDMQVITFVVTEDCNLECTYCYERHKTREHVMPLAVACNGIDFILSQPCLKPAAVLEFIGGEPTLEMELIREIVAYFRQAVSRLPYHPWRSQYVFSLGTNGTTYLSRDVQQFLWENRYHSRVSITIDGTKQKHDMHRRFKGGRGSYDSVAESVKTWIRQFPLASTKVTIASDDLPYLCESIIHLWDMGITSVPANVVFEDAWKPGDPAMFESQLRQLADISLDKDYWRTRRCTLFWTPRDTSASYGDDNWCGTGEMMAIDYAGNLYPCVRFMGYSLCSPGRQPRSVGTIFEGFDQDKLRAFYCLRKSLQSPGKCLNCDEDDNCAWCTGLNYDVSGSIFERLTFICEMHKAQARANRYYWEQLRHRYGVGPGDARQYYGAICSC